MPELRQLLFHLRYPPLWGVLALSGVLYLLAIQLPFSTGIDAASFRADPYLVNFQDRGEAGGREGRWTHNYSYISFPGTGGNRPLRVAIEINPDRSGEPGAGPVEVAGFVGGVELYRERVEPGLWTIMQMEVSPQAPQAYAARDLVIELRADTYRSPDYPGKDLGMLVGRVTVEPLTGSGGPIVPSARMMALAMALPMLLYLLLARAGGFSPNKALRRTSALVALLAVLVLAWATAASLADVGLALPHLVMTLVGGWLLLVGGWWLLPRIFRGDSRARLGWVGVALCLAFLMRFGISGLPQTNVVDLPYHLKWLNVLLGGGFMELYLPGELSSVPPEWGLDVLIPKSPLFYVVMWPLGLLRAFDLAYTLMLAVSLLDALAVLGIYALVRRVCVAGAVWAALVYAVVPLSFRAFIYGILPTIFAQALILLVLVIVVLWPEKLAKPVPFVGWTLLLAGSLIAFPTALAFNSFMVVALGVGWVWRSAASRRALFAMLGGVALALTVSFAAYYQLYVESFLSGTLPALQGGVNLGGRELWPGGVPDLLDWTARYAIVWVLWPLIPVMLLVMWRWKGADERRLWVLLLAWLAIFVGGLALNLRIDMIGKHIYYTLPAACVAGGLFLWQLYRTGTRAGRALSVLVMLYLAWAGLQFFAGRL